jgi:hypothetical protein
MNNIKYTSHEKFLLCLIHESCYLNGLVHTLNKESKQKYMQYFENRENKFREQVKTYKNIVPEDFFH